MACQCPSWYSNFCLGDHAEPHHESQPHGTGLVVRQAVEGETDLLAKPVDFVKTWDSRKTGARYGDVSFWRPVPPAGYVALGDVTNANNDQKPSKDSMRCVHKSMVVAGQWAYPQAWWDSGSGGSYGDASLWCARPKDSYGISTHTFKSDWAHCFPLSFQPYVLKNQTKLYQTSRADGETSSARQGRKVTLMSHTGRFLRLRENGEAFTSTWAGAQDHTSGEPEEAWMMAQTQQKASFMNRHGLYLSCKPSGELEGVPEASSGEGTEFEVMIVNDKVSIKSHLGKYLTVPRSADSDAVAAQSDKAYSWTLNFLSVTSGVYATFRSQREGLFMSATSDGAVVLVARDEPGPQEKWTLHEDERKLTLLSSWGYYLSVAGGTLSARSPTVTESERFWRFVKGENKLAIRSKLIDRSLTAVTGQQRVDVSEKKDSEPTMWIVQLTFYS